MGLSDSSTDCRYGSCSDSPYDQTVHAEPAIPAAPSRWVTDTAGLLSEANRDALDARLQAYEASSGHQVVVWIGRTMGDAPLDEFAVKVFQAWRIGRKGHDDGVLVLLLADDRAIDIEVGYGLEGRLTDALSHRIIDEIMVPRLRAGQPDAAVSAGVDAVLAGIEGRPVPNLPKAAPVAEPLRPSTGASCWSPSSVSCCCCSLRGILRSRSGFSTRP
jgi:uncharacterized protein